MYGPRRVFHLLSLLLHHRIDGREVAKALGGRGGDARTRARHHLLLSLLFAFASSSNHQALPPPFCSAAKTEGEEKGQANWSVESPSITEEGKGRSKGDTVSPPACL